MNDEPARAHDRQRTPDEVLSDKHFNERLRKLVRGRADGSPEEKTVKVVE